MVKIILLSSLLIIGYSPFSQKLPSDYQSDSLTTLKFSLIDSSAYKSIYEDQAKRDSLKKLYGKGNRHREALAIEKYLLAKNQYPFIERQSVNENHWNIRLGNGNNLEIKVPKNSHIADYTLEKYHEKSDFIVFRAQWHEGNDYLLVNSKSGEKILTWGSPIFNESGEYFITNSADLIAGYSPNGIQLFKVTDGKPELILQYRMEIAPSRVQWTSENSFRLETFFWSGDLMRKSFEHYNVQIISLK